MRGWISGQDLPVEYFGEHPPHTPSLGINSSVKNMDFDVMLQSHIDFPLSTEKGGWDDWVYNKGY